MSGQEQAKSATPSHWMRPELPQGFDSRELFDLMDRVSKEHWKLMPEKGLPQTPRAKTLRVFGQYLMRRYNNGKLAMDASHPPILPFANAVGRIKHHQQFNRVLDELDKL